MAVVQSMIARTRPMRLGMTGHQSARMLADEWLTPPEITAALGPFDLDPCSPAEPPWPIAPRWFTAEDDGLIQPWSGRVWLNPPYGQETGLWLRRLADHGSGVALVFARTETRMFLEQVWACATAVLFLRGRLTFYRLDGRKGREAGGGNSGAPSVLIAYSIEDAERLRTCGIAGQFIRLEPAR